MTIIIVLRYQVKSVIALEMRAILYTYTLILRCLAKQNACDALRRHYLGSAIDSQGFERCRHSPSHPHDI